MDEFKLKLLYNKGELFCTKTESLNFKVTLSLAKLDSVGSRLVSNGLIVGGNITVRIQLVILLLLSNISELSIWAKTKKMR